MLRPRLSPRKLSFNSAMADYKNHADPGPLAVAWPLWLLHALGAALGWLTYALSPSYRRRLKANARRAGVSVADRRASVAEAGRLVAELPRLWLRPAGKPIADPVRWEGADLLQACWTAAAAWCC
jgi:lauroyl/myristoyl acyltransferase